MSKRKSNSSGVYQRGSAWWVDFVASDGRRIRKRVQATTKVEAIRLRSVLIADAERGELRLPGRKRTTLLHDVCDRFLEHQKLHTKSLSNLPSQLKRAKEFFGNVPIDRITRAQCEEYKNALAKQYQQFAWSAAAEGKLTRGHAPTFKPATADAYLGTLKRVFSWCEERGVIDRNPAAKVKRFKKKDQPYHLITPEEERRLLEAAEYRPDMPPRRRRPKHLKSALILAMHTGARRTEVTQLKWSQVNLDAQIIAFTETKNGKIRHVPLDDTAFRLLKDLHDQTGRCEYVFDDGRGKASSFGGSWHTVRRKAGVPGGLVFHSVRHTTASRLVMNGVDLTTVGEILGNPTAVRRYVHLVPEHLKKAIKTLDQSPACHKYDTSADRNAVEKAV